MMKMKKQKKTTMNPKKLNKRVLRTIPRFYHRYSHRIQWIHCHLNGNKIYRMTNLKDHTFRSKIPTHHKMYPKDHKTRDRAPKVSRTRFKDPSGSVLFQAGQVFPTDSRIKGTEFNNKTKDMDIRIKGTVRSSRIKDTEPKDNGPTSKTNGRVLMDSKTKA